MKPEPHTAVFTFGDFQVDCRSRELRRRGVKLRVQHQPFQVLAMLVAADGEVVTRDQLRNGIWDRDTHVDFDRAINKAINRLRQFLGDDARCPRFIETLPKHGYRFLARVARGSPRMQAMSEELRETLLKARHFGSKRTADDLDRSVTYFRRAIEQDPECAPAWAGLAEAYVLRGLFGLQKPHDAFPSARAAAERALKLDDTVTEAHTALGDVHKLYEWDWDAAERAYRQAIAIDPRYPVAHHWYAQLLAIQGRHREALKEIETARRSDPLSVPVNAFVSYVWFEARQYARAVSAAQEALELDRNSPLTHLLLGRAYGKAGEPHKAVAALKTAARLAGPVPLIEANLGYAYARAGLRSNAERILGRVRQGRSAGYDSPVDLALISLGLGDREAALAALEEAHRMRAARMLAVSDPLFAELAHESRYQQLLARLRLPLKAHT
jgi:DNA-binding winged helix-turn-helix (wHTH) protein/Flp pilus assembly protein TadD